MSTITIRTRSVTDLVLAHSITSLRPEHHAQIHTLDQCIRIPISRLQPLPRQFYKVHLVGLLCSKSLSLVAFHSLLAAESRSFPIMFSLLQSLAILAIAISLTVAQGTGVTTSTTSRVFVAYGTSSPSSIQTIHKTVILDTVTRTSTSRVTTTSPLQFTTTVPVIYLSTLNVTSTFRPTTSVFTSNSTIVEYSTFNETSTQYLVSSRAFQKFVAFGSTVFILVLFTIPRAKTCTE